MISLVIATFDRPRLLERSIQSALAALAHAGVSDFEILVGVNGPDPRSRAVLEGLSAPALKSFYFDRKFTPAGCRNRLIPHARGEWIYFLDDDAYVDRAFFKTWEKSPLRESCAAVGGPNLNPPSSNLFQDVTTWTLESRFATYFSFARYRGSGSARFCSEESLILCNLFVRKSALSEHSFLEELKCAEENWLLQDVERGRGRLGYDPDLAVWHERRPDLAAFARQVYKYGFGRGQIFRRRASGLRLAHLIPSLCLMYALLVPGLLWLAPSILWLLPFPVYFVLCLAFAFRPSRARVPFRVRARSALLFPLVHAAYGWGLMRGAWRG